MNIRACLENEHSKSLTLKITTYVSNDEKRFKELMILFFGDDRPMAQRAAWPMSHIVINNPNLLRPYFKAFVEKLNDKSAHPALARNIFRVLQEIEIPEKYQGRLVDQSFKVIMSETQPAAVRAFALTVAAKISKRYPELKNELLLILKELRSLPQLPSLKVRIKMALKELETV